jgi:U3 small nucleolar RNA-associated protein 10
MTSLAAQLQAVASAVPREEKLKGKASLLYDIREAADIDLATIYAVGVQGASPRPPAGEALPPPPLYARRHIPRMARSTRRRRRSRREPVLARRRALDVPWHARARAASLERPGARSRARCPDASRTASVSPCRVSSSLTRRAPNKNKRLLRERRREFQSRARFVYTAGFTELCRSDGRFEAYQKPLFSRGASETNRELQDKAFNDRLNVAIEGFLRLLSGRFATAAAARCLEYLIRRFKIHVYNVEAAVTCALPYHATAEFVKLVQLANLENTSFYWLKGVKEKGAAPPRDGLVARCARDGAFLSFVCEAAAASASAKVPYRTACFFVRFCFFFRRRSCSVGVVTKKQNRRTTHRTTTTRVLFFLSSRRRFRRLDASLDRSTAFSSV